MNFLESFLYNRADHVSHTTHLPVEHHAEKTGDTKKDSEDEIEADVDFYLSSKDS